MQDAFVQQEVNPIQEQCNCCWMLTIMCPTQQNQSKHNNAFTKIVQDFSEQSHS